MVGVTRRTNPVLRNKKVDYSDFMRKYQLYEAIPEIEWIPPGYVKIKDTWMVKGLCNSGGLSESEAKMVENLLSRLNDQGKKAIQLRLMLDRKGDHHRGLDRLVNKLQRPSIFVVIDSDRGEIFQKDYLKLKIVDGEIVWEDGSILEGLQLEEASSMPML